MRLVTFLLIGFLTIAPSIADACLCMPPPASEERARYMLERNAAVFVGRVEQVTSAGLSYGQSIVTVAVSEAFKGVVESSNVEILWQHIGCGIGLEQGDTYLFFVHRSEASDMLTTGGCNLYQYITTQANAQKYAESIKARTSEILELLRAISN